jgi:hypothetical protein
MAPNGTKNDTLTAKQEAVALALASGHTIKRAASECKAGQRTVKRWIADHPAFARRVAELRGEAVARATGKLADGMALAADVLRALLGAKSESVRLGACRAMLELGIKLRESAELEQRLAALEQLQTEGKA